MDDPTQDEPPAERLSQLSAKRTIKAGNPGYTKLVRTLKLVLPLVALAIVAVVLAWPNMDQVKNATQKAATPQQAGSNELIHAHFEGIDSKQEPYVVTANRAIQSAADTDIIYMDHPTAHLDLKGGGALDGQSIKGTYKQKSQLLLLEGAVKLRNNQGYHSLTDRLLVDLQTHKASTDTHVSGDGPDASIEATGLQGNQDTGTLVFTGPARLILKNVKAFR